MPDINTTPAADLPVYCHRCKWEGTFGKLVVVTESFPGMPFAHRGTGCPACLSGGYLEFKEDVCVRVG